MTQPEIFAYLNGVVDRYGLRQHIALQTGMTRAEFDEDAGSWTVRTDRGVTFRARFLVTGLGLLSATNLPDLPGMESFEGRLVHTGAWPEDLDLTGQRVGVIGNGSTGNQVITATAPIAAHLTSFQRTPQYSVPAGNRALNPEKLQAYRDNFEATWEQVRNSNTAMGFEESTIETFSVSAEERERIFQDAWNEGGGFRFMFETFCDIATNEAANEEAAKFIRGKIAEIVKDPETARKLTPTDLYARRPLCDSGYYQAFNRPNVTLVNVKETPISTVTEKGVLTADGTLHELDVLVCATGFDAVDGNYVRVDIRGRDGLSLTEHWSDGPTSYLGMATSGFPNMFMILGPNGPFTNLPPSIETQVDWIGEAIRSRLGYRRRVDRRRSPDRVRLDRHLRARSPTRTLFPKGRVVDLRREHPGQEADRDVLPGRHQAVPVDPRGRIRRGISQLHDQRRHSRRVRSVTTNDATVDPTTGNEVAGDPRDLPSRTVDRTGRARRAGPQDRQGLLHL